MTEERESLFKIIEGVSNINRRVYEFKNTYSNDVQQLYERLVYINGLEQGIMRNLEDEADYWNLGKDVKDIKEQINELLEYKNNSVIELISKDLMNINSEIDNYLRLIEKY